MLRRLHVRPKGTSSRYELTDHNAVLQDPSVAAAPIDKRVAFLQSKNLTQEEVDASLARAGDGGVSLGSMPQQGNNGYPSQQLMRQPPSQYGYNEYQGSYWQQPPPPEYAQHQKLGRSEGGYADSFRAGCHGETGETTSLWLP